MHNRQITTNIRVQKDVLRSLMENHQLSNKFAIGLVGNILQRRIITKQDLEHLGPINFEDNKTKMVLKGEYFFCSTKFLYNLSFSSSKSR